MLGKCLSCGVAPSDALQTDYVGSDGVLLKFDSMGCWSRNLDPEICVNLSLISYVEELAKLVYKGLYLTSTHSQKNPIIDIDQSHGGTSVEYAFVNDALFEL
jgi:hypothetical protein